MKTIVWSSVLEEIVFEILLRLPVKSLYRFRCVSKSWFTVISDPKFISLHLDRSLAKPKMLLISISTIYKSIDRCKIVCSIDYAEWRSQRQSPVVNYHCQIPHGWSVSRLCLSVGGLSLAEYWNKTSLLICNPSTRESIRFNLPSHPAGVNIWQCHNKSYLGFDPVEKKHKVLSSWMHRSNPSECLNYVITLGEDAWRPVECKYTRSADRVDICIDGVIYFLSRDASSQYNLIGFDVHLETFKSISVPLDIPVKERPFLIEYGGCGCVAVVYKYDKDIVHQMIVIAILTDNEKWKCKEYFVPRNLLPLGWENYIKGSSPNGELVFVSPDGSNSVELDCYDLETKRIKKIKVRAPKDQKCTWSGFDCVRVCPHIERLESLQGLSPAFYQYRRY